MPVVIMCINSSPGLASRGGRGNGQLYERVEPSGRVLPSGDGAPGGKGEEEGEKCGTSSPQDHHHIQEDDVSNSQAFITQRETKRSTFSKVEKSMHVFTGLQ